MDKNFVFPDFENCLLNVPPTVLSFFGIETEKSPLPKETFENIKGCDNLVLFLIDGFGFNIYEREAKEKYFFKAFSQKGKVSKITSVFPPTTAAAITTITTGKAPIEHGLFEWYLYLPKLGEIVESLPYNLVETQFSNKNAKLPKDFSEILNEETISEKLNKKDINSFLFLPSDYSEYSYSKTISKGGKTVGYKDLNDLLSSLINILEDSRGRNFSYVYWPDIDTAQHYFGVWSEEVKNQINLLSKNLEENFLNKISKRAASKAAIIFTADHGQEPIDLENVTLLNNFDFLTQNYERNSSGNPILPAGNPRDLFLHVRGDRLRQVVEFLKNELKENSEVINLNDEIIKKLFGKFKPHNEFYQRLGNILILSKGKSVCYYEYNILKKLVLVGHHGSLLESEMIIPFGCTKVSDLI